VLPSLFLSHGAPSFVLERGPAFAFMQQLGSALARPEAIVMCSAHWDTPQPVVSAAERPETIHDFFGFPPEMYEIRYSAPGSPALARRVAGLLAEAGLGAHLHADRGLDHGAWSVLLPMFPEAEVPVLQLSLQSPMGAAHHLALGRALAPLREDGVLVIGSGGATHDLRGFGRYGRAAPAPTYVAAFRDWLNETVTAGDWDALADYRRRAPEAARNHPSEEHFLPLLVAAGAGEAPGRILHDDVEWGVLAMTAYAFD